MLDEEDLFRFLCKDTSGAGTIYPSWGPEFTPVVSGVRVTQSLALYVCFVNRCLSFCHLSFDHCPNVYLLFPSYLQDVAETK
jgi:hypothetical protein